MCARSWRAKSAVLRCRCVLSLPPVHTAVLESTLDVPCSSCEPRCWCEILGLLERLRLLSLFGQNVGQGAGQQRCVMLSVQPVLVVCIESVCNKKVMLIRSGRKHLHLANNSMAARPHGYDAVV